MAAKNNNLPLLSQKEKKTAAPTDRWRFYFKNIPSNSPPPTFREVSLQPGGVDQLTGPSAATGVRDLRNAPRVTPALPQLFVPSPPTVVSGQFKNHSPSIGPFTKELATSKWGPLAVGMTPAHSCPPILRKPGHADMGGPSHRERKAWEKAVSSFRVKNLQALSLQK